jgi:hypothetical protein
MTSSSRSTAVLTPYGTGVAHAQVVGNRGHRIDFNTQSNMLETRVVGAGFRIHRHAPSAAGAGSRRRLHRLLANLPASRGKSVENPMSSDPVRQLKKE